MNSKTMTHYLDTIQRDFTARDCTRRPSNGPGSTEMGKQMSFVDAALGWLFGATTMDNGIDWEAKARSDAQMAERRMKDAAYAAGWKDWIPPYMNTLDKGGMPYDWPRVWIWRVGWEFPSDVDPRQLDPQMNAIGLLWKPWAASEPRP